MNKSPIRAFLVLAAVAAIALAIAIATSPGLNHHHKASVGQVHQALRETVTAPPCTVPLGSGHMGVCAPKGAFKHFQALEPNEGVARQTPYRGEDVSSYQGCKSRRYLSFLIIKVFEWGYGADSHANCHFANNTSIPTGPYFFARPGNPVAEALVFANTAKSLHATKKMPGTMDMEVPGISCSDIIRFGNTYMKLTGNRRFIVYSALFAWPGCGLMPPSFILYDAAYGPFPNTLSGFARAWLWQYSDGRVGPTPHLDGGDSDIFLVSSPKALVAATQPVPPPPPIPYVYWKACSQLDGITTWKKQHGHVSSRQHRQAVADRTRLRRGNTGCSKQPHSYPYRLPYRKGALA